jgi:hypothetical protein
MSWDYQRKSESVMLLFLGNPLRAKAKIPVGERVI